MITMIPVKSLLLVTVVLCVQHAAFSQALRFNLMYGFANYSGDIQQKSFTLNQARSVITAGFTYDIGQKFLIRSEYSFARLGADDKYNKKESVRDRNLNFKTIIKEVNIMGEYNIFDLTEKSFSPYIFGGVSGFYFNPYTYSSDGTKAYLSHLSTEGQGLSQYPDRLKYKPVQIALPMGAGIKYALSDDIHIGVELGVRKLFTDYLDDVSSTYVNEATLANEQGALAADLAFRGDELKTNPQTYPAEGSPRGGVKKDWYYFGQARISFRLPWFNNGGNTKSKSRIGCPSRVL